MSTAGALRVRALVGADWYPLTSDARTRFEYAPGAGGAYHHEHSSAYERTRAAPRLRGVRPGHWVLADLAGLPAGIVAGATYEVEIRTDGGRCWRGRGSIEITRRTRATIYGVGELIPC